MKTLLYRKLRKLHACRETAELYKGKTATEAIQFIIGTGRDGDLAWVITMLAQGGYLKSRHIDENGLFLGKLRAAYDYGDENTDPYGDLPYVWGEKVIAAMLRVITPRMIIRAMGKVKV